jgi:hypothetical protein
LIDEADKVIKENQLNAANETVEILLLGAQFDRFRVSSTVLELSFLRLPKVRDLPISVWLTLTGSADFLKNESVASTALAINGNDDFFDAREKLLGLLYRLIGKTVELVYIDPDGVLQLQFESTSIVFFSDKNVGEEVWAVTSETPEPYAEQSWAVTLTDDQDLVTRRP